MANVQDMPSNAFGYVPTPALVAPIEFTMRLSDYAALGGHMSDVKPMDGVLSEKLRKVGQIDRRSNPNDSRNYPWRAK